MNKKESYDHLINLLRTIDGEKYGQMWIGISELASFKCHFEEPYRKLLLSQPNQFGAELNNIRQVASAIAASEKIKMSVMFLPIGELSADIKQSSIPVDSAFYSQVDLFYKALNSFVDSFVLFSDSTNKVAGLYRVSIDADGLLNAKYQVQLLGQSLDKLMNISSGDEGSSLEIYLANVESLKIFSEKINAISVIYSQVMNAIGISEAENPMRIEHLEYGSFWFRFSGNEVASSIITAVLTLTGTYLHKEYAASGQIEQMDKAASALHKLIDLEERIRDSGVDTTQMHEQIVSSSKKIARDTYRLLHDQADIEINGEPISIGSDYKQGLLEQSRTISLEHFDGPSPTGG